MRPEQSELEPALNQVISVLEKEDAELRPRAFSGEPGGLVLLDKTLPTVIIPDVHAREELLRKVLSFRLNHKTIQEHLDNQTIQLVCLGDIFHTEVKTSDRWKKAFFEFKSDYAFSESMDIEMTQNFNTMMKIMHLKIAYPKHFHLLKGNHENILNEDGDGNHSFGKIVMEGMMTKKYLEAFYGVHFLFNWSMFEKMLPLAAAGNGMVCSHAQPKKHYGKEKLIEYRLYPELIEGFTWTSNHQAEPGSLRPYLNELTENHAHAVWISGHRPVKGKYKTLESGDLIQIHNPARYILAIHFPDQKFLPDQMVIDLSDQAEYRG